MSFPYSVISLTGPENLISWLNGLSLWDEVDFDIEDLDKFFHFFLREFLGFLYLWESESKFDAIEGPEQQFNHV